MILDVFNVYTVYVWCSEVYVMYVYVCVRILYTMSKADCWITFKVDADCDFRVRGVDSLMMRAKRRVLHI